MSAVSWKELITVTTRVFYNETLVFILFCDIVTFWLLPLSILPHCCCFFIMFITGFLVSVFSCASASRSSDVLLLTLCLCAPVLQSAISCPGLCFGLLVVCAFGL